MGRFDQRNAAAWVVERVGDVVTQYAVLDDCPPGGVLILRARLLVPAARVLRKP